MSLNLNMNTSSSSSSYSGIAAPFKFDGKDYPIWKAQMIALLAMQGLSDFIVKSPREIVDNLIPRKANKTVTIKDGSDSVSTTTSSSTESKEVLDPKENSLYRFEE